MESDSGVYAAVPADGQSMVLAVTSRGAATMGPATGTTLTTELVARTGAATTPQPARLAPAARISITPTGQPSRIQQVKGFILSSMLGNVGVTVRRTKSRPQPFPTDNASNPHELPGCFAFAR